MPGLQTIYSCGLLNYTRGIYLNLSFIFCYTVLCFSCQKITSIGYELQITDYRTLAQNEFILFHLLF